MFDTFKTKRINRSVIIYMMEFEGLGSEALKIILKSFKSKKSRSKFAFI